MMPTTEIISFAQAPGKQNQSGYSNQDISPSNKSSASKCDSEALGDISFHNLIENRSMQSRDSNLLDIQDDTLAAMLRSNFKEDECVLNDKVESLTIRK